ncbi:hypothetical protein Scep_019397 [Stephania cephalantha]|uniref:Uncharacterized protein n=1 Tax=Stephania cephalantha TaxID=152367 RepID=A0AAP0NM40_9MAGN
MPLIFSSTDFLALLLLALIASLYEIVSPICQSANVLAFCQSNQCYSVALAFSKGYVLYITLYFFEESSTIPKLLKRALNKLPSTLDALDSTSFDEQGQGQGGLVNTCECQETRK